MHTKQGKQRNTSVPVGKELRDIFTVVKHRFSSVHLAVGLGWPFVNPRVGIVIPVNALQVLLEVS